MRITAYHDLPSGGAKRALHAQVRGLVARGHQVHVIVPATADESYLPLRDVATLVTVRPRRLPPAREAMLTGGASLADRLRWLGFLARLSADEARIATAIDATRPDVVMVHHSQFTQSPHVLRHLRGPTLYYCQEPLRAAYEPHIVSPLLRAALRLTLGRTDRRNARAARAIAVNSRYSARRIAQCYGVTPVVVRLGVDLHRFRPDPGISAQREVLSVGALHPLKGHDTIIDALATLPSADRVPLRLVADRERVTERRRLEARAAAAGVTLRIETRLSEEALRQRYASAAVVAYTPHREPFGLVALEAMAAGRPVVGVAEGGLPETIVDGETGFLVPREPALLGARLHTLLSDVALAARMGTAGRAHVEAHWRWETAIDALESVLQDVAAGRPPSVAAAGVSAAG